MAGRMQDQLVAGAQQSLLEASHAARRAADPQSFMVDAFTEIVEAYGRESALAARDYAVADYAARGARVSPGEIELSAPVFEQADSSARWAVFGAGDAFEGEVLHRLQGALTRLVLQPYRETVLNAARDHGRYTRTAVARVPEAGACAFCRMLASRGAVYGSAESAQSTKDGRRFHDHCRCSTQISRIDGRDLPQSVRDLEREWGEFSVETDSLTLQSYEKWLKEKRAA